MAKQLGLIKISGTIENICFYKSNIEYYVRRKSSLSGKRVRTSDEFKETMRYAGLLSKASKIASAAYRLLPREKKDRRVYQELTGKIMLMLKDGMSADRIMKLLQ